MLFRSFGIARRISGDESRLTMDGDTMGTPHFMAPESYLGLAPDPRVDVWGLGATLYFLLTARRPFEGYTGDALTAAVLATAVEPPSRFAPGEVPPALDAVVLRALARDREARFPRVEELALALAETCADRAVRLGDMHAVLAAGGVESRLAAFLVDLSERFGDTDEGGEVVVPIALSRSEIAASIATTPETTIRVLSRWAREGIVDDGGRGFVIHAIDALRELADPVSVRRTHTRAAP